MRRGGHALIIATSIALIVAGSASAAHQPSRAQRAAIVVAVQRGAERLAHAPAPAVRSVRVSSFGPWALARVGPFVGTDTSVALVARVHGNWTLVAESAAGGICDVGESRAVDTDLGVSRSFRLFDEGCSVPTTRTQSCGRATGGGGYPLTDIRARHLTCADAESDALAWLGNIEYGRCGVPLSCRVHASSPILSFLCHIQAKNPPVHPYRYSSTVTCRTPLQRFSFILNNRP